MIRKQAYQPLNEEKHSRFLELTANLSQEVALWKMACNKNPDAATLAYTTMHQG